MKSTLKYAKKRKVMKYLARYNFYAMHQQYPGLLKLLETVRYIY